MALLPMTITGNLTRDPWLKKLQSGTCVGRLRVAASRRVRDEKAESGWRDVDTLFINVELWGQLAVNVRKSLLKGMPVIVTGFPVTREWTDREGNAQQQIILRATQIGLDLSRHIIGSRRSEPTEHNVDNVQLPTIDGDEHFDAVQEPSASTNSFGQALADQPRQGETDPAGDEAPEQAPEGELVGAAAGDGAGEGGGPPF